MGSEDLRITLGEVHRIVEDTRDLVRAQNSRIGKLETAVAVLKTKLAVIWAAASAVGALVGGVIVKKFGG